MSRYKQSSNPFESDDTEEDFSSKYKSTTSQYSSSTVKPETRTSGSVKSSTTYNRPMPQDSSPYQNPQRSSTSHSSSYSQSSSQYLEEDNPFEDRRSQLQMKIANSENTQLESTQRALASIYESEAMGIATGEELLRQGETLNNIESKTENMQQNMKVSQRHLNNIKSVFGGIKNWWSGDKKPTDAKPTPEPANARLRETITKTEKAKPDVGGFYDDDEDLDSQFKAAPRRSPGSQYTMIEPVTRSGREEEIDSNLGQMLHGMTRLKGLAVGLGDEIERQNEQLDRINVKVEKTDQLLTHQNTQMKRILKK
jgi:synaptosomal-associated protein 29